MHRWAALPLPLITAIAALVMSWAVPLDTLRRLTTEGGTVERPTEWLYFAAAGVVWLCRRPGDGARTTLALCTLMLAFGAREMDLHKHWTGTSVLKFSFFLREPAPLQHKLIALLVLVAVTVALLWLLRRHALTAWRRLRDGAPWAASTLVFFVVMGVSKVFDRSVSILTEDYGVTIAPATVGLVVSIEEVIELSLPLIAMLAMAQYRRAANS